MRRNAVILAGLAAIGMISGTVAQAGATRAADQGSDAGSAAESCRVEVTRNAGAGTYNVTRQVSNGQCTCFVSTGPSSQGGSAEASVAAILRDRSCAGAPPAVVQTAGGAGGAGGSGAMGTLLPVIGVAAAAAGVAAATGSSSP